MTFEQIQFSGSPDKENPERTKDDVLRDIDEYIANKEGDVSPDGKHVWRDGRWVPID